MSFATALFNPAYFWILNNDTLVKENTLEYMLARMTTDSSIGICGSSLLFYHQPEIVQAYGGVRYSFWTGRGWNIGLGQRYSANTDPKPIEAEMTYISGASMLVSRTFYQLIGPMNESFFLYNEELDWAWRAKGRLLLACEPKAMVFHKEGASIGTESVGRPASLLSEFYQARNKLKFTLINIPWCAPTVWFFLAARAVRKLMRGERVNSLVIFFALFGRQQPASEWTIQRSK
jgi:GT2 family glycosyltransferase